MTGVSRTRVPDKDKHTRTYFVSLAELMILLRIPYDGHSAVGIVRQDGRAMPISKMMYIVTTAEEETGAAEEETSGT
jgi:hypothetical protein